MLSRGEPHSRPKRKERHSKHHKGCSSRPKRSCEDATSTFKEIKKKENYNNERTLLSLLTKDRVSQKVGLYSNGKLSNPISRRKPLGTLHLSSSNKCSPTSRPPAHSLSHSPPPLVTTPTNNVSVRPSTRGSEELSHATTTVTTPKHHQIMMDTGNCTTPAADCSDNNVLLTDIATNIMTGLKQHEDPHSTDPLQDLCTQLRKTMRQCDPMVYYDLQQCFADHTLPTECYVPPILCSNKTQSCSSPVLPVLGESGPSVVLECPSSDVLMETNTQYLSPSSCWLPPSQHLSNPTDHLSYTTCVYPSLDHLNTTHTDDHSTAPSSLVVVTDDNYIDTMMSCTDDNTDTLDTLDRPRLFPHRLF